MKVWMDFQGVIVGSIILCILLTFAILSFAEKNLLAGIAGIVSLFFASVFLAKGGIIDMAGTLRLDGEGIVCKCWRREEKRWKWEEVYECGVVWGVTEAYGGGYPDRIYFSKKAVEDRVKNGYFFQYQFRKYEYEGDTLIVVRYSEKLIRYLRETGRLTGNSRIKNH